MLLSRPYRGLRWAFRAHICPDRTVNNLGTVRKLHNVLFPVNYDSQFYSSLTDDRLHHPEDYCKLIYYQDLPVGVLVCRLEENDHAAPKTLSEAVASASASSSSEEANGEDQSSSEDTTKEGDGKKASTSTKPQIDGQKTYKLYVMTLGVLA